MSEWLEHNETISNFPKDSKCRKQESDAKFGVPLLFLIIMFSIAGLYLFADLFRLRSNLSDLLEVEAKRKDITLFNRTDDKEYSLDEQSTAVLINAFKASDEVEILVKGTGRERIIIRRLIHRDFDEIIERIGDGERFYIRYEQKPRKLSVASLGSVWVLIISDNVRIDPVTVLINRERVAIPTILLGAFFLFIIVPFLLLRRRAATGSTLLPEKYSR